MIEVPYLNKTTYILDEIHNKPTPKRMVGTGGCFWPMHDGHISLLQRMDAIFPSDSYYRIVLLNSNAYIRSVKEREPDRSELARVLDLYATGYVDEVFMFNGLAPSIRRIVPNLDYWIKGLDYANVDFFPELADTITTRLVILDSGSNTHSSDLVKENNDR